MSSEPSPSAATDRNKKRAPKYPTWEYPKGSGIKIAEMPNRTGGETFGVSYQVRIPSELIGIPNKRELHQRKTRAEAERFAEDRLLALRKHGTEFAKIPADVQKQAAIAWGILDEHNNRANVSLNLIDAVKAGIRVLSPTGGQKTFAGVCEELRASKAERLKAGGLDPTTEKDFRRRSVRLEETLGDKFVSEITTDDITKMLRKMRTEGLSHRSVLNYRNTLAEILRHAKAKQYSHTNPFENFTREDYKNLGGEKAERNLDAINILTIEETRRLLRAGQEFGDAGLLASVVLRLFCGLRTTEASKLDWSEVHWLDPKPFVHIPFGKAKKRRIRLVDIPANALAWLKVCNPLAAGRLDPRSPKQYTRRVAKIARKAGIGHLTTEGKWKSDWENNDTRHSFGSYHYALHGDAILTARLMGHKQNDDVLFAHYRTLVRKEEAEKFFALVPEVESEKVTEFPQAATA